MKLTTRQKKYVNKKKRFCSTEQMAKELEISPAQVAAYIDAKLEGRLVLGQGWSDSSKLREYQSVEEYLAEFSWFKWWQSNGWIIAGLAGLVLLAYINGWTAEFVSDDVAGIAANPRIYDWAAVWVNPFGFMRPLYYYLVANTVGLVPAAFRAINIVSHIVTVGVVYWLVMALVNRRTAMLAAGLMAVHPLAVESVTWISGGAHSQLAALGGLAMICYLLARGKGSWRYWLVGWLFLLAALFFSEKAVMLPGLLLLYHLVFDLKPGWWRKWWPYLGLSLIWIGIYARSLGGRASYLVAEYYTQMPTGIDQWWQVPVAVVEYIKLILWPIGLTLYHSETSYSPVSFGLIVTLFVILSGLIVWWYWRAKGRGTGEVDGDGRVAFWLAWLIVALSPTLVPYGLSWIVAERYVYMGMVGGLVVVAMGFDWLSRKKGYAEVTLTIFGLLVLLLLGKTWVRNNDWRNQDNLWLAAARTSPSSSNNHNNLGDLYGRRGELDRAVGEFKLAIKLKPGYADAYHNLANTYVQKQEWGPAEQNYLAAIKYNPRLWQSHQNLAAIYFKQERFAEALTQMRAAAELKPNQAGLQVNLGLAYNKMGDLPEARAAWQRALVIEPGNELARQMLDQTLNGSTTESKKQK